MLYLGYATSLLAAAAAVTAYDSQAPSPHPPTCSSASARNVGRSVPCSCWLSADSDSSSAVLVMRLRTGEALRLRGEADMRSTEPPKEATEGTGTPGWPLSSELSLST